MAVYFSSSRRRGKDHAPMVMETEPRTVVQPKEAESGKHSLRRRKFTVSKSPIRMNVPSLNIRNPQTSREHSRPRPTTPLMSSDDPENSSPRRRRLIIADFHRMDNSSREWRLEEQAIITSLQRTVGEEKERRYWKLLDVWKTTDREGGGKVAATVLGFLIDNRDALLSESQGIW